MESSSSLVDGGKYWMDKSQLPKKFEANEYMLTAKIMPCAEQTTKIVA